MMMVMLKMWFEDHVFMFRILECMFQNIVLVGSANFFRPAKEFGNFFRPAKFLPPGWCSANFFRPALQDFFSLCWGLFDAVRLRACLRKTNADLFISATLCPQNALHSSSDASLSSDDEERFSPGFARRVPALPSARH